MLPPIATRIFNYYFLFSAFIVPAGLLVIMGYLDCDKRNVAVAILTLAVTSTSLNRSAYSVNHVDIAPRQVMWQSILRK